MVRSLRIKQRPSLTRMQRLHAILGLSSFGFVVLLAVANSISGCPPAFLLRPDYLAWIGGACAIGLSLLWASRLDDEIHRFVGSSAAGALTGLFLGTLSVPVLAAPLTLVGWFRLPRSRRLRVALIGLVPLGAILALALPYVGRGLLTASQHGCG